MTKLKQKKSQLLTNGSLLEEAKAIMQMVEGLRKNQFQLYYQPYIHLITGEIIGVEALIRWYHPEKGLLLPGQFLPLAEKTNVIIDIENWVVHRALSEVRHINKRCNTDIKLSINVSAQQFTQANFLNNLKRALNAYQYAAEDLTLEITERYLLNEKYIALMEAIRLEGGRISIDDFGTSYASLQYLMKYPIDEIKIDRSFISGMEKNGRKLKVVQALITLSHELGLTTVGEGVETNRQYELLKSVDCMRAQGFFFKKPLPFDELVRLCKQLKPVT